MLRSQLGNSENHEVAKTSPAQEQSLQSRPYVVIIALLVIVLLALVGYAGYSEYARQKAVKELTVVTQQLHDLEQTLLPSSEPVMEKVTTRVDGHNTPSPSLSTTLTAIEGSGSGTAHSYTTVRQVYPAARAVADPTSSLVGALGVEARNIQQFKDCFTDIDRVERGTANIQPENARTNSELHDAVISLFSGRNDDPTIADGKASAWIFSFQGPTGYQVVVVNALDSRVVFNRSMPLDAGHGTGRTGAAADVAWIDSDQMMRVAAADIPNYEARRREAILAIHTLAIKEGQAPFYNTAIMGRDDICRLPSGEGSVRDWEWADILIDAMSGRIISRGTLYEGNSKEGIQPQDPPTGNRAK